MFLYPWGDMHSLNLGWFLLQFKDWVEKIQEYLDNGGGTSENLANVIAPVFNAANYYAAGDYVLYNNELYKADQAVNPGTWDQDAWTRCLIVDEMGSSGGAGIDNVARLMIAGQYSASYGYQKYAICRYNDKLWMCNTNLPSGGEAWNAAHWDEITVGAGLTGLRRSVETFAQDITNLLTAIEQPISIYEGKKVSIIGDSISTFDQAGYKYDNYNMYYPRNDITDVDDTWWKKVLDNSGAVIEENVSFSGSRVTNTHPNSYPDFYARVTLLGSPDTIFVELGSNDSLNNIALGNYDFTTAYTSLSESTFRPAYIKGMKALQALYPNAEICAVILHMDDEYKNSIIHICDMLSIKWIDVSKYESDEQVQTHPNKHGMRQIASSVLYSTPYPLDVYTLMGITTDPASIDELMELKPGYYRVGINNGSTIFPSNFGILEIVHSGYFGQARYTRMNSTAQNVWVKGWNRLSLTWYDSTWQQLNFLYPGNYAPTFSKCTSNADYQSVTISGGLAMLKLMLTATENIGANTATALATGLPIPRKAYQFIAFTTTGTLIKLMVTTAGTLMAWYTNAIAQNDIIVIDTTYLTPDTF